jgi:Fungal chitosanase of glycosyl hydrolase group 75
VVPLGSTRFDAQAAGVQGGAVAIVIYDGRLAFGVFGDEGPADIIGEASYAMAQSLGIDPNPATGGVDSGVTFIVLTGMNAVVSPIENHQAAVTLGEQLAMQLLANN